MTESNDDGDVPGRNMSASTGIGAAVYLFSQKPATSLPSIHADPHPLFMTPLRFHWWLLSRWIVCGEDLVTFPNLLGCLCHKSLDDPL